MQWCITTCVCLHSCHGKKEERNLSSIVLATPGPLLGCPRSPAFPKWHPPPILSGRFGAISRRLQAGRSHMGQKHYGNATLAPTPCPWLYLLQSWAAQTSRCGSDSYLSWVYGRAAGKRAAPICRGRTVPFRGLTPRQPT